MLDMANKPASACYPAALLGPLGVCGAVLGLNPAPLLAEPRTPWNPTPRAQLRALATDRPDKTETPFTVDAGHVQVEMDLVRYEHDRTVSGGVRFTREDRAYGPMLVKLGLLHHLDFAVGIEPYREAREEVRTGGERRETWRRGMGPMTLRAKLNLWGNDAGRSALALLPGVQLPTAQEGLGSEVVEPALGVPFSLELTDRLELGAQTGALWVGDADGRGHHFEVVNSITLGLALSRRFSGYVEFWTLLDPETADAWQGTFDFGLNYLVNDHFKLDLGLNVGVTESAPDWNPFLGLSWRR
jgi:hypothetical protein